MKWLRKNQVCQRYGNITPRTLERMVNDGRLPLPEFPYGNRIPAWQEETLDAHDRDVVKNRKTGNAAA
jgi:hypothetical protein